MLCTNCGQAIPEGAPFCRNCGTPAPQTSGTETAETTALSTTAAGPSSAAVPPLSSSTQAPPPLPSFTQAPPPPLQTTAGYGAGWQPPQTPPTGERSRTGLIVGWVAAGIILLAGLGVGLYFGLRGDDSDKTSSSKTTVTSSSSSSSASTASTSTTEEAFAQKEGEIFLEAAGTSGPDSFTGETFVPAGPPSTLNIPTTTILATTTTTAGTSTTQAVSTTTTAGESVQVAKVPGDTPALYGGSKSKALADKEGQLRFLEQNPDKAAAFCAALNSDPTLRWSGGTQVQPAQLRDYFAELTPMMLTRDTRVTNYGYRNGQPTPRQSVLQAGQMVLVDSYGVPRVRCECGNPLTPPQPVKKTPKYTGPKWPDFDPTVIIVIQPTIVIIETFVIIDIYTGEIIDRPAGTIGDQDISHEPTAWSLDVAMTWDDSYNKRVSTINWTAQFTLNPDGSLSGTGQGTWHTDGTVFSGPDNAVGTWVADASLSVDIGGTSETTELGRTLKIQPLVDYTIDNVTWNAPGDNAGLSESLNSILADIIPAAFTNELDLEAASVGPVLATVTAGDYGGGATLTPLK